MNLSSPFFPWIVVAESSWSKGKLWGEKSGRGGVEKRKFIGSVILVKSQVRLWFILIYPKAPFLTPFWNSSVHPGGRSLNTCVSYTTTAPGLSAGWGQLPFSWVKTSFSAVWSVWRRGGQCVFWSHLPVWASALDLARLAQGQGCCDSVCFQWAWFLSCRWAAVTSSCSCEPHLFIVLGTVLGT